MRTWMAGVQAKESAFERIVAAARGCAAGAQTDGINVAFLAAERHSSNG